MRDERASMTRLELQSNALRYEFVPLQVDSDRVAGALRVAEAPEHRTKTGASAARAPATHPYVPSNRFCPDGRSLVTFPIDQKMVTGPPAPMSARDRQAGKKSLYISQIFPAPPGMNFSSGKDSSR